MTLTIVEYSDEQQTVKEEINIISKIDVIFRRSECSNRMLSIRKYMVLLETLGIYPNHSF